MAITTADILRWLQQSAQVLHENSRFLTDLDSAIGDADHGTNMDRGFKTVVTKVAGMENADIGTILKTVGSTLVSTVGGASGPLYGTAFLRAGTATAGKQTLEAADVVQMLNAMVEGIQARGKATFGEKTMLDALIPALDAARQAQAEGDVELPVLLRRAAVAAEQGMQNTTSLIATKGRASYLGERSINHQDPGATSSWLLLKTLADVCDKDQE